MMRVLEYMYIMFLCIYKRGRAYTWHKKYYKKESGYICKCALHDFSK